MKRSIRLAAVIMVMSWCLPVVATPPSGVELKWDAASGVLVVTARHYTLMPGSHYIKSIRVEVDGKTAAEKQFTSQADNKAQVADLALPDLQPGAVVKATAFCSLYGSGSGVLKISAD